MRKLGVGVIGAGFSGKMHAGAALANGARLVGIVGADEEKSRRVAEQLGAEERFADARSLIEHHAVDVVHVCTPNVFHVPLADYALAQGKHLSAGAAGSLTVSQVSAGRKNRIWLEIDGSQSSLAFDEERAEQLWLGHRTGNEVLLRDPQFLSRAAAGVTTLPAGHNEGFAGTFAALLGEVYEAALGSGEHRYPTFDDGLRAVRLTDAVLRSSAEHSWVEVDS